MTYSLELQFHKTSKNQMSGSPLAQIYVKTLSSDEKGHIFITPHCVTFSEIEEQINRLMKELEIIRKIAKQKFTKENEGDS